MFLHTYQEADEASAGLQTTFRFPQKCVFQTGTPPRA